MHCKLHRGGPAIRDKPRMTKQRKNKPIYDPKQRTLFFQERRQAWLDAIAAKELKREAAKAAKIAADAEAAAEAARKVCGLV